jgi:hypothetical protein
MTLHRAAVAAALALTVSACGGGGGGGIQTAAPVTPAPVTPAPVTPAPVTPAPVTPAPVTPTPVTISIAGPTSTSAGGVGSPAFNFTNNLPPVGTVFRIHGPIVQLTPNSISNGGFPTSEPQVTFRGTVTSNGATFPVFDFNIAGIISAPNLRADATTQATTGGGTVTAAVSALDYTMLGAWSYTGPGGSPSFLGHFATGSITPVASVPVSGTATYIGNGGRAGVVGAYFVPSGNDTIAAGVLSGNVSMNVNFGTNEVSGQFTNMTAKPLTGGPVPWNDVMLTGNINRGSGVSVSANTRAAVAPAAAGSVGFSTAATGGLTGAFYGPSYNEMGGTWTLSESTPDGGKTAFGTFGGTR